MTIEDSYILFQGIQITATTPTASAVRLETEAIDLEVSNRVQMASREANPNIGKILVTFLIYGVFFVFYMGEKNMGKIQWALCALNFMIKSFSGPLALLGSDS